MKAPPTKKGRASSKNDAAPASSKLTKISAERQLVQRLQYILAELSRLPLPIGELGCQLLDAVEYTDKIRIGARQKARELLLREPGIIPHWHVSETAQQRLSPDTTRVFDALSREDDTLSPERFQACSTNLGAVRKLLAEQNPECNADEIEHSLNRLLLDLIRYEHVAHLARSKNKHPSLSLP